MRFSLQWDSRLLYLQGRTRTRTQELHLLVHVLVHGVMDVVVHIHEVMDVVVHIGHGVMDTVVHIVHGVLDVVVHIVHRVMDVVVSQVLWWFCLTGSVRVVSPLLRIQHYNINHHT